MGRRSPSRLTCKHLLPRLDEVKCKYILPDQMARLTFLRLDVDSPTGVIERLSEGRVQGTTLPKGGRIEYERSYFLRNIMSEINSFIQHEGNTRCHDETTIRKYVGDGQDV